MDFEELELECRAYQHANQQEYGGWIWQVTDAALNTLAHISVLEAENAALKERMRWIPVSEKLPEDEEEVLLFAEQSGLFIATFHNAESYYGTDIFVVDGDDMAPAFHPDSSVLHWMPKPEAPKEDA